MKAMVIRKLVLVALVFCAGFGSARPSEKEFNLFCRILEEADRMLTDVKDYVYDESKDREILGEMQVLFNATTDNMDNFRKMLWDTKDFFEAHPPPTQPESRKRAHNETGKLIGEAQGKIQESLGLAKEVHKKMEGAKLSLLQGIYGEHVTVVPKDDGNLIEIRSNTTSTFEDHTNVKESCGSGGKQAGKTLLNDFFCACVGEGDKDSAGPCSAYLVPPKNGNNNCCEKECCKSGCCAKNNCCGTADCCKEKNCCNCCWTQLKYASSSSDPLALTESFQKIEEACWNLLDGKKETKKITSLLEEYVGMIGKGGAKNDEHNKINTTHMFGQSGWGADDQTAKGNLKECTGGGTVGGGGWAHNNRMCVDYTKNYDGKAYHIPWHKKFKEASEKMKQAKDLEDQILKNRADLLLLKSKAWNAYNREKDDETSNLDDMNMTSDKKDAMAENKSEAREYIDVSQETKQPSQPSQPAPGAPDGRKYTYISSTESTQEEAPSAAAGGGEPKYIYLSSTGTPSQQTPAPETPSPTQQDPPTQPPGKLRDEDKTGE